MNAAHTQRDRVVRGMFDRVAARYDLLNSIISLRLDRQWRRQAVAAALRGRRDVKILDLGAGTGDLSFEAARQGNGGAQVFGLDFSMEMLRFAAEKKRTVDGAEQTFFVQGSALLAPFKAATFDGIITAFVLRNVSDLEQFFREAYRVVKPGGMLVSLDMFPPPDGWFRPLYAFYFYRLVPWIGDLISSNGKAYHYLSRSVRDFHSPETVAGLIENCAFSGVEVSKFLNGAVCMHVAQKPTA